MKQEIDYDILLKEIPNKYILSIICGQRARRLTRGADPLVKVGKKYTIVKKVLKEVCEGKIFYNNED